MAGGHLVYLRPTSEAPAPNNPEIVAEPREIALMEQDMKLTLMLANVATSLTVQALHYYCRLRGMGRGPNFSIFQYFD